jgi:hypothetical protein
VAADLIIMVGARPAGDAVATPGTIASLSGTGAP